MKIGGYSHFNGITFFCDVFKIKGSIKKKDIDYSIEWIIPPKWLRNLENKFIIGGLLTGYYQWKVLSKKMRLLFLFLIGLYFIEGIIDLSYIYDYISFYMGEFKIYLIVSTLLILIINFKKTLKTFRYHGAEHKAINCFEKHRYVDYHLIKQSSRFNKRCGSNIVSIFLILYTPIWFLEIDSLTVTVIIFLISVQIIRFLSTKNYKWNKYIQLLQWVTVLEPKDDELKVAVNTFNKLLKGYNIYKYESKNRIKSS